MNNFTRFRAYQLGEKGSLCSYAVDSDFTLIEARINDRVKDSLDYEFSKAQTKFLNELDITSWDQDHCNSSQLAIILENFLPSRIEYPGYPPDTDNGKNSLSEIETYVKNNKCFAYDVPITDNFIEGLDNAEPAKSTNVLYNPLEITSCHNDNSVVKLYRTGRFTVLSLGDCESKTIADRIMNCGIACKEVDVLILAHHGADNGFTTKEFLQAINPRIAVCTSDRGNMYGHPDEKVRKMLSDLKIPLYTTKDGDVLVTCGDDNICHAYNMVSNNARIKNYHEFKPKYTLK